MSKPIFIIGLPAETNSDQMDSIQKNLYKQFKDYHVLVYCAFEDDIRFECFYEKDFNEVKYEELKQIVKERINLI